MRFHVMAPRSPARRTRSSTRSIRTRPLLSVDATFVPKTNAATKFQKAAQSTARSGVRTRVETTVAMELAASCQPFENSNASVRKTTINRREKLDMSSPVTRNRRLATRENQSVQCFERNLTDPYERSRTLCVADWRRDGHQGGLGGLKDYPFDDVGDVFALVDGGFDDFKNFFPLDDLHGIGLFIEKLGNQGAAKAIAFI